jgi:hypothetical protein
MSGPIAATFFSKHGSASAELPGSTSNRMSPAAIRDGEEGSGPVQAVDFWKDGR